MKKILFSLSLLAKNKSALNGSKLTLASRLLYMSTEVANRAERVNRGNFTLPVQDLLYLIITIVTEIRN